MPATAARQGDDIVVSVGPVLDLHGAQIDDGAVVRAVVRDSAGTSAGGSIAVVAGAGRIRIPSGRLDGELTVSVALLGIQSVITVP
jgi:hypothetical protein